MMMEVMDQTEESSWNLTTTSNLITETNYTSTTTSTTGITYAPQIISLATPNSNVTSAEGNSPSFLEINGGSEYNYSTPFDKQPLQQQQTSTEGYWFDDEYDFISHSHLNDHNSSQLLTDISTPTVPFLLHIYGFATLYIWLDLFIAFMALTSKKRVVKRPATLGIVILSASFSTNFAVLLIADPYGVRCLLPKVFVIILLYFKYMSFIIVFWLIQGILKSMSAIKQLHTTGDSNNSNIEENNKLLLLSQRKKVCAFAPLCLVYFCILLTIGIMTALKPKLHLLHLIPQAIYVTSMIVLCFTFLYSALNISQYTKQTSRVLDETIIYSKMQSKLKENGRCADVSLDLYRVKRDKLDFHGDLSPDEYDEFGNRYEGYIHGTDSSSNESLAFFNHVALSNPLKLEELFVNRQKAFLRDKEELTKKNQYLNGKKKSTKNKTLSLSQNYAILESTTDCGFSSDNGDVSVEDSQLNDNVIVCKKNTFPVKLKMQKMAPMLQGTKAKRGSGKSKSIERKSLTQNHTTVFCNDAFSCDNHYKEQTIFSKSDKSLAECVCDKKQTDFNDSKCECNSNLRSVYRTSVKGANSVSSTMPINNKTTAQPNSVRKSNHTLCTSAITIISETEEKTQNGTKLPGAEIFNKANVKLALPPRELLSNDRFEDNGYLADSENTLIEDCNDIDSKEYDKGDGVGHENGDKTSCYKSPVLPKRNYNYLGLQRVRKGRCVKRIMQVTYCTTLFAFLLCVLELYEMFSVKGILTGRNHSAEYTWLLFESFMRFSEVGFVTTVIRSVQLWGRPRRTVTKRPVIDYTEIQYSAEDSDSPVEQSMC